MDPVYEVRKTECSKLSVFDFMNKWQNIQNMHINKNTLRLYIILESCTIMIKKKLKNGKYLRIHVNYMQIC